MNRYLLLVLAILLLPSMLPAQPGPNADPGQPPPPPAPRVDPLDMLGKFNFNKHVSAAEATPNGLFVLGEGVLTRYSPDLEQCATLQLLPPLPPPMDGDDKQAMQKWFNERALRSATPAMLPAGDMLYIVCSGMLFRVNQNTLKAEKTTLDPLPQPGGEVRLIVNIATAPLLKLQGDTLYIVRQVDLIAVDLKTGAVLKRVDLPKEMMPAMPGPIGPMPNGMAPQPGGVPFGAGEADRAMTVVGVLGSRKVGERTAYLLKDDAGVLYLLAGEQVDRLAAQGNLEGKRARVTGMLEPRGAPAGINSTLRVQGIQFLGE